MMDAQGWNECTATHRAVTEGNISILRVSTSTNVHILHVHLLHVHLLHVHVHLLHVHILSIHFVNVHFPRFVIHLHVCTTYPIVYHTSTCTMHIHIHIQGHNHPILLPLKVFLSQGANVNITDLMRRTPLHMTAARRELMECSIALLEAGAQIMVADILGLRPYDLSPVSRGGQGERERERGKERGRGARGGGQGEWVKGRGRGARGGGQGEWEGEREGGKGSGRGRGRGARREGEGQGEREGG